jgi:thioester reductase-like protein
MMSRREMEGMPAKPYTLLTGATGFLGRYLLRDLLLLGQRVVVLVRSPERLYAILEDWANQVGQRLPRPVVFQGDLGAAGLGLGAAERQFLSGNASRVLHAAGSISFLATPDGEPWRTNVDGIRNLLDVATALGLSEWHHVSTAFVCGKRPGPVREEELACGQEFHNVYERSKHEAERLLNAARRIAVTIHRPSVIVGDSRTGYTSSYVGLYRFLEVGARLAGARNGPAARDRHRCLPLRLCLDGSERCDLVPVDWVSAAIVQLMRQPSTAGRTYHLTARSPATARLVQETAADVLGLSGMHFVGRGALASQSRLEQAFYEGVAQYWPYLCGMPDFDSRHAQAALPDMPPPTIDRSCLHRLMRYAVEQRFGRRTGRAAATPASIPSECARYIEETFPPLARQSHLARAMNLHIRVAFDIDGAGGGQWSCCWERGAFKAVSRGLDPEAAVVYRTDPSTFHAIVSGRETPQQAFFDERIAITGDLEVALKLAALFERFLAETPAAGPVRTETLDAAPS